MTIQSIKDAVSLVEKAQPGELHAAQNTAACWEICYPNWRRNHFVHDGDMAALFVAAVNLLRTHGQALIAAQEDAWRPIETAPKDEDVLVYFDCATVPIVHIAWFASEDEWNRSGRHCSDESMEDYVGWWSYTRGSVTQEKLDGYRTPTHWRPLPEPPQSEEM